MKSITVFVEANTFSGEHQGTRTYLKELYLCLIVSQKTTNFVFASSDLSELERVFGAFENVSLVKYRASNKLLRYFHEIPEIIERKECNYAHFQYILPFVRSKHCKYVLTIHDVLFLDYPDYFPKYYSLKRKFLFRRSALNCDFLFTVSEYSRVRMKYHLNLARKRIDLTSNGISS